MIKYQQEVIRLLEEVSKSEKISLKEVKLIYTDLFTFLIEEFSQITHTDPNTWDKNIIIKNFGKFVINKSRLKNYGNIKKAEGESN
jgi:hypothetical protein